MVADFGSTRRAAEALYTSQPNVSKVVAALERDMGVKVFTRTNKGTQLTPEGRALYRHAREILQSARVMRSMARGEPPRLISVACYPSFMISRLFCDLYNELPGDGACQMEFFEGTVQDIADRVARDLAEIGIVYIAESQQSCFTHVIGHSQLEFTPLSRHEACLYVGPNNPLYGRDAVTFAELSRLRFVQPFTDFFSMEHHLDRISVGILGTEQFHNAVSTNSDSQLIALLLHTDVCSFGIRMINPDYKQYDIRDIPIRDCGKCLTIGYMKKKNAVLSPEIFRFLDMLAAMLGHFSGDGVTECASGTRSRRTGSGADHGQKGAV